MINLEELTIFHAQIEEHIHDFSLHHDCDMRLGILNKGRTLIAKYFKISLALNHALQTEAKQTEELTTMLRRYNGHMASDAKKIVGLYMEYGHGCDNKPQIKFQTELAEVLTLLQLRIENEQSHLIPAYITMKPQTNT